MYSSYNMRGIWAILILIGTCLKCQERQLDDIVISGNVQNIPTNKLYLSDARQWDSFIDSAEYVNGEFKFIYHAGPDFEPFLANISYVDFTGKIRPLIFKNNILSNDKTEFGSNAFYIERAPIYIEGNILKDSKLSLRAGQETNLLYGNQFVNWGAINDTNQSTRQKKLAEVKKAIGQNKNSFYLLNCILNNRYSYSRIELNKILNSFSENLKKSYTGQRLDAYINGLSDARKHLKDISLINERNARENAIEGSKELNILIFWGSWCAPCRMEIPALRDLYGSLPTAEVRMVSIAIDDEKENWLKALNEEKMKWTQLYANQHESEDLKILVNIPSVPLIIITNQLGTEVYRESGFSHSGNGLRKALDSLLAK